MPKQPSLSALPARTQETGPRAEWCFVILAGVPFDDIGGGQRPAQFATQLLAMGYDVWYIYRYEKKETACVSVDLPPRLAHASVRELPARKLATAINARPCFIVEVPHPDFAPYLDLAADLRAPVVYERIDDWQTSLGGSWYDRAFEHRLVRTASLLTGTARRLVDSLTEMAEPAGRPATASKPAYLANAVDPERFDANRAYDRPADFVSGRRTLLYSGSLYGEWFDWELLEAAARRFPDDSFLLIGDYQPRNRVRASNIHFLGLKPQAALPAYLSHADVCLIPFRPSALTAAVSPLKVFEYLAMGKPVVATDLPEVRALSGVHVASDHGQFLDLLASPLSGPADVAALVARHAWPERLSRLVAMLPACRCSIIILCHNNRDIIRRCVDSVLTYPADQDCEVIVVDNASTDGSAELLETWFGDRVRVCRNERNGCASGRNLGIENACGEILVFLDSDQYATRPDWLRPAFDILRLDPSIGAVGWAAGWMDDGSAAGPTVDYFPDRSMLGDFRHARFRHDIAYLGSGGLVVPRYVLHQTRHFDEAFDPTCFEDVDFSFQVRAAGYRLAYCPYLGIGHRAHATVGAIPSDEFRRLSERNHDRFVAKWAGQPGLFAGVPEDLAQNPGTAGRRLVSRSARLNRHFLMDRFALLTTRFKHEFVRGSWSQRGRFMAWILNGVRRAVRRPG